MALFLRTVLHASAGTALLAVLATAVNPRVSDAQTPSQANQQVKKSQPQVQTRQPQIRPAQVQQRPAATVRQQVPKIVKTAPSSGGGSASSGASTRSPAAQSAPIVRNPGSSVSSKVSVPKLPPRVVVSPNTPSKIVTPTLPPKVAVPSKVITPTLPSKIVTPNAPGNLPGKVLTPTLPSKIVTPNLPGNLPGKVLTPTLPPKIIPLPGKLTQPTIPLTPPKVGLPWKGPLAQPAPGLNKILPFKPVKPGLALPLLPKLPPVPPKKWAGPAFGTIPQRLAWHPWAGKKVFPYFFVGVIAATAVAVPAYSYWVPPPPSCYAGGSTVYYYPGTRVCFDFAVAQPEDPFECHGRVFRWKPARYRTVETLIAETADESEVATEWIEKEPSRKVIVQASMKRATERAQSVAKVPLESLDCSTCLAALGPTEGDGGLATVSLVNNCDHDVTVAGGLAKVDASPDTPPVCEFVGDIPKGGEVAACTKQVADFAEGQLFLNSVIPAAGTTAPAPACRIPEQRAEAPLTKAQ